MELNKIAIIYLINYPFNAMNCSHNHDNYLLKKKHKKK